MQPQVVLDAIYQNLNMESYQDSVIFLEDLKKHDKNIEHAYNRYIREHAKQHVAYLACRHQFENAQKLLDIIEEMLRIDATTDFDAYMQLMEWRRDPDKRFYQPRRHVLWPVVCDLQDLYDDKLDFYALSTPPRIGKSTIGCFFMSFSMGNHPNDAHLMSGFSDKLTESFYKEMMSLISDADTYCFSEIFPNSKLADKNAASEVIDLDTKSRFPTLTCRSVGGTLTGAVEVGHHGILYCDDMVEDYEQALNGDRMDKLYAAYLSQLYDRKLPGAKEFHIGTRWVPNDIIGREESTHAGDERFRFRRIPALNENGESNFMYTNGMAWTTEKWLEIKEKLLREGLDDNWSAKYMCDPFWREGRLYEEDDLRFYDELPEGDPDIIMAVCDTKTKGPDFCVQVVDYVYGDDHYIHAVTCDDGLMENIEPKLVDQLVNNHVQVARYESNVAGGRIARDIEGRCQAAGLPIVMKTKYSTENKETRILADSGWVKQRCLFKSEETRNSEYTKFIQQLLSYNAKSKNKHDDVPDAMSMLRRFVDATLKAKVHVFKRPW